MTLLIDKLRRQTQEVLDARKRAQEQADAERLAVAAASRDRGDAEARATLVRALETLASQGEYHIDFEIEGDEAFQVGYRTAAYQILSEGRLRFLFYKRRVYSDFNGSIVTHIEHRLLIWWGSQDPEPLPDQTEP